MATRKPDPALYSGDLFGEFYQTEQTKTPTRVRLRDLFPGIATSLIVGFAALWLSQQYGIPAILAGLLLGLALHFLSETPALGEGLDFVSRHFLRVGIVLLGLQVSFAQIAALGWQAFAGLLVIMGAAFAAAMLGAQLARQGEAAGVLAGGATAICGASAALALYGVIGRDRLDQARFTLTLVGITLASALALTFYPLLAVMLSLSDPQAGYLVGASIHDAAQAIGGGYAISDEAGAQATVIKLARVAMLAPMVTFVALWLARTGHAEEDGAQPSIWRRLHVPWFIVGFFVLVAVGSAVSVPPPIAERGLDLSKFLLLLAVAATAMRSNLSVLVQAGWKPFVPVLCATLASLIAALAVTILLIE